MIYKFLLISLFTFVSAQVVAGDGFGTGLPSSTALEAAAGDGFGTGLPSSTALGAAFGDGFGTGLPSSTALEAAAGDGFGTGLPSDVALESFLNELSLNKQFKGFEVIDIEKNNSEDLSKLLKALPADQGAVFFKEATEDTGSATIVLPESKTEQANQSVDNEMEKKNVLNFVYRPESVHQYLPILDFLEEKASEETSTTEVKQIDQKRVYEINYKK